MTTLCTLFGLFPLALGLGAGSELQRPLALAVIGGLTLSTPITLFAVPTLLVAIRGRTYTLPAAGGVTARAPAARKCPAGWWGGGAGGPGGPPGADRKRPAPRKHQAC